MNIFSNRTSRNLCNRNSMTFYRIYNNRWDFQHLVSFLKKASSEFCSPCGFTGKILARRLSVDTSVLFPVRSDCLGFDSSTPEGMRGVLGAELKFMGHDRKLSLLPPAPPPQPHRERACTQATRPATCVQLTTLDGLHM